MTTAHHGSALVRLADWSYRRRKLVVLLWIGLFIGTATLAQQFGGDYEFTFATPGSESTEAQDLLKERFPARGGDDVDVVFEAPGGVRSPDVQRDVDALLARLRGNEHVASVESPYEPAGARRMSRD